jgi:hypothetical protein
MGVLAQAKNTEEISCSQWEGSACTQSALFFFLLSFCLGGAHRERGEDFFGGGKGKKYWATCKVIVHRPHGEWTITFYMHR